MNEVATGVGQRRSVGYWLDALLVLCLLIRLPAIVDDVEVTGWNRPLLLLCAGGAIQRLLDHGSR